MLALIINFSIICGSDKSLITLFITIQLFLSKSRIWILED